MSQLITIGNEAILEKNVSVLSDSERHFALHFLGQETWRTLLNDERLNLATILLVTGPHDYIAHGSVADPTFLAIQDPAAFDFASRCLQTCSITAIIWFSQAEAENFLELNTSSKEPLLLFLVTQCVYHSHADGIMDEKECGG